MGLLGTFFTFLFVISLIVFIHEFGHYFFARLFGVKVESFSIGFGKEIIGFNDKHGTRWKFCLVPAGGYVKMFGDSYASLLEENESSKSADFDKDCAFAHKPLYQRSIIALGGPLANFLSAILIIFCLYFSLGKTFIKPVVTQVFEGSVAYDSGIQEGDLITEVDGNEVEDFSELARLMALNTGDVIHIRVKRGDEFISFNILPSIEEVQDISGNKLKASRIGIASNLSDHRQLSFFDALSSAFKDSISIAFTTLKVLKQIVVGDRNAKEVGGPIKIAQHSADSLSQGIIPLFWLIASLSVNLALVNLLPIPVLDGGHILHNLIEKFTGRDLAMKIQSYSLTIGTALVLLLFVAITFNDLTSIFAPK